jgi:DNA-binding MarR family transcriptional regulator
MMRTVLRWVLEQVYASVVAAGYDDLSRSQVWMFRYPTPDGLQPSELADLLQITKQSVNDLLHDMEARGYLMRKPHPTDGRARVIRLTAKGRRLEQTVYEAARSAQEAIADMLGPRRFAQLHQSLEAVVSHIAQGDLPGRPPPMPDLPSTQLST